MAVAGLQHGVVVEFDREVGLGVVERDDGSRLPFHCIEIADGSRDIEVGQPVTFDVLLKLGRAEAAHVVRA